MSHHAEKTAGQVTSKCYLHVFEPVDLSDNEIIEQVYLLSF